MLRRTTNLEEKLFLLNASLEVLSVKWHPEATNDLFILFSNNSIRSVLDSCKRPLNPWMDKIHSPSIHNHPRLYNEMLKLRHVWRLNSPTVDTSRYSVALGETAVDFDFGAPRFVQDTSLLCANEQQQQQPRGLDGSQVSISPCNALIN